MELCIVIPAHNEERRIELTVRSYVLAFRDYQEETQGALTTTFIIVLNGCTDSTKDIIQKIQAETANVEMIVLANAGKGLAVHAGFQAALKQRADLIGFVDADMATRPEFFYKLVQELQKNRLDGVIASRYMYGSIVVPPRPFIKRWGSKAIFESLVKLLFWLPYHDFQCGAKLFTKKAVEKIVPFLSVEQWAFDIELLYLCKKFGLTVQEVPTIWFDQPGSKLRLSAGFAMLGAVISLRIRHSPFKNMASSFKKWIAGCKKEQA